MKDLKSEGESEYTYYSSTQLSIKTTTQSRNWTIIIADVVELYTKSVRVMRIGIIGLAVVAIIKRSNAPWCMRLSASEYQLLDGDNI